MIEKVHLVVFHKRRAVRNLFTAIIVVVKIKGTTIYLPTWINKSAKNDKNLTHATLSVGRINAASTPNATPIKYLIQTFIDFNYNILWIDIPEYVIIPICLKH